MKFNIYKRRDDGSFEDQEFDYEMPDNGGFKMPMPHCDQSILHAPGACQYCDHYPQAQALRDWWRINYTGEHDPGKAPCPSTHFRKEETRDLWPGNTTEGYQWTS